MGTHLPRSRRHCPRMPPAPACPAAILRHQLCAGQRHPKFGYGSVTGRLCAPTKNCVIALGTGCSALGPGHRLHGCDVAKCDRCLASATARGRIFAGGRPTGSDGHNKKLGCFYSTVVISTPRRRHCSTRCHPSPPHPSVASRVYLARGQRMREPYLVHHRHNPTFRGHGGRC